MAQFYAATHLLVDYLNLIIWSDAQTSIWPICIWILLIYIHWHFKTPLSSIPVLPRADTIFLIDAYSNRLQAALPYTFTKYLTEYTPVFLITTRDQILMETILGTLDSFTPPYCPKSNYLQINPMDGQSNWWSESSVFSLTTQIRKFNGVAQFDLACCPASFIHNVMNFSQGVDLSRILTGRLGNLGGGVLIFLSSRERLRTTLEWMAHVTQ